MRVVISLFVLIGGVSFACAGEAEKLSDKIGVVAAYLRCVAPTNPWPSQVFGWANHINEMLLSETQYPTGAIVRTIHLNDGSSNTFDTVGVRWIRAGQEVVTKQTRGVWGLYLPRSDIGGRSGQDLEVRVNALAREYLAGFSNRVFRFAGTFDGVKVFDLVGANPQKRDGAEDGSDEWIDSLWAVADDTAIGFSCRKPDYGSVHPGGTRRWNNYRWPRGGLKPRQ